jgi:ABC-type lipopolysaccharide export system ATPase subunit
MGIYLSCNGVVKMDVRGVRELVRMPIPMDVVISYSGVEPMVVIGMRELIRMLSSNGVGKTIFSSSFILV